jgi:hypothetical protein
LNLVKFVAKEGQIGKINGIDKGPVAQKFSQGLA